MEGIRRNCTRVPKLPQLGALLLVLSEKRPRAISPLLRRRPRQSPGNPRLQPTPGQGICYTPCCWWSGPSRSRQNSRKILIKQSQSHHIQHRQSRSTIPHLSSRVGLLFGHGFPPSILRATAAPPQSHQNRHRRARLLIKDAILPRVPETTARSSQSTECRPPARTARVREDRIQHDAPACAHQT